MQLAATPGSQLWRLASENCPSGWSSSRSLVPSPWIALAARADLILVRDRIAEAARYYHHDRAVVVRTGLDLDEERWHLWHELVHADDGDEAGHTDIRRERWVDREAARRAMPITTLIWAFGLAENWHTAAALLKLPEARVRWYVGSALEPDARDLVRRASARAS
ncbi:hypothetical protein KVF89_22690 [Nocardioides carbamazepini]|uniref:hypothetical protein n=1 Tax=Nocardioides carbamazepini TaxID=2854259 RepID=UPI002149CA8D|nr:hypothetical protein [Nocardioides carbamazepini]MCR1785366.1 hypothetical protein [Nocardioides carbamazepini]